VSCRTRYETPGKTGETRGERNERFKQEVPLWDIPDAGLYLWEWFYELSEGVNRVIDGQVYRLTWSEIAAWIALTRNIVLPSEIDVLKSMDIAYCEALEGELGYARAISQEEAEAERARALAAAKSGRRGR